MDPASNPSTPKSSLAARIAGTATFIIVLGFATLWFAAALLLSGERAAWFGLAIVLICIAGVGLAWWRKLKFLESWRSIAVAWAICAPVLLWLSWDEKEFTQPLTLANLSPAPEQAEKSYALTLAYTKLEGAEKAGRVMAATNFHLKNSPADKAAKWSEEIQANRDKIAAEWAALAPERAWLEELNGFAAIGDTSKLTFDTPIMYFTVVRRVAEATCAQAGLLALDGQGDAALALLEPLVSVLNKLERHGRTEVRILASQRSLETCWATLRFVLAAGPVSVPARQSCAKVLADRDLPSVHRRLAWLSYVMAYDNIISQRHLAFALIASDLGIKNRFMIRAFSLLVPFAFLEKATANYLARVATVMEQVIRDPDSPTSLDAAQQLMKDTVALPIKNFGGRGIIHLAMPNYHKMGERLQKGEKLRLALLEELNR